MRKDIQRVKGGESLRLVRFQGNWVGLIRWHDMGKIRMLVLCGKRWLDAARNTLVFP